MLKRILPVGFSYFNVGHSILTDRVLAAVATAGGTSHIMVHDVIPLEYPEYQRPETVEPFRAQLRRVARRADRVIYNSKDTRQRAEAQMRDWGRTPPCVEAPLGVSMPVPDTDALPPSILPGRPYFVTVGTIEPRKNHRFLLDMWDEMGPDAPPLLICGRRGWNNANVFERLDNLTSDSPIRELSGLSDAVMATLMLQSAGCLFPSLAEGFGLPPAEAVTLGARVLCNKLPIFREILGNSVEFASVNDSHLWLRKIKDWEQTPVVAGRPTGIKGLTWANHFGAVLN